VNNCAAFAFLADVRLPLALAGVPPLRDGLSGTYPFPEVGLWEVSHRQSSYETKKALNEISRNVWVQEPTP
jgi:hypothetical protein